MTSDPKASPKEVEPITVEQPTAIQPREGATVDKTALREEQPVGPKEASPATNDEVAEALQTLASTHDQNSGNNRGDDRDKGGDRDKDKDRDHGNDRDKPRPPKDPDPQGWQCKDKRGPSWCPWPDWDYDRHSGYPVFENNYTFDLKFVYFDNGTRIEIIVRAGTSQPIVPPRAGDYSFLVFGVSNPNFALNVGMGTFRSGGHCDSRCTPPPRPTLNLQLRINVWVGQTMRPYDVPVYDCGCGVYQRVGDRNYYRYYRAGTLPVIGYWEGPPQQQGSNFVPVSVGENPVAATYTPVTSQNLGEVLGVPKPLGGDPSQNLSLTAPAPTPDNGWRVMAIALGAAVLIVIVGGAGYGVYRKVS